MTEITNNYFRAVLILLVGKSIENVLCVGRNVLKSDRFMCHNCKLIDIIHHVLLHGAVA